MLLHLITVQDEDIEMLSRCDALMKEVRLFAERGVELRGVSPAIAVDAALRWEQVGAPPTTMRCSGRRGGGC